jgi:putative membrane protein
VAPEPSSTKQTNAGAAPPELLITHAVVATLTYLTWAGLALRSRRSFGKTLPGDFSHVHRRLGWAVFGGLVFTALSAIGMYWLIFVF